VLPKLNAVTGDPPTKAWKVAPLPVPGLVIVTVGALVYPAPEKLGGNRVAEVIDPVAFARTGVAAAPLPPPPTNEIVGGLALEYPEPPESKLTDPIE